MALLLGIAGTCKVCHVFAQVLLRLCRVHGKGPAPAAILEMPKSCTFEVSAVMLHSAPVLHQLLARNLKTIRRRRTFRPATRELNNISKRIGAVCELQLACLR